VYSLILTASDEPEKSISYACYGLHVRHRVASIKLSPFYSFLPQEG
jgi:hypothetical protein